MREGGETCQLPLWALGCASRQAGHRSKVAVGRDCCFLICLLPVGRAPTNVNCWPYIENLRRVVSPSSRCRPGKRDTTGPRATVANPRLLDRFETFHAVGKRLGFAELVDFPRPSLAKLGGEIRRWIDYDTQNGQAQGENLSKKCRRQRCDRPSGCRAPFEAPLCNAVKFRKPGAPRLPVGSGTVPQRRAELC